MALKIDKEKELPSVTRRGGRKSEETKQLEEAVAEMSPKVIRGVPESDFNALSQKVRYAAGNVGLGVKVRNIPDENEDSDTVELHFEGFVKEPTKNTK